ncbi:MULTISPECIES: non-ribosomal peptide synthetase [unclassified Anabaena]|uniref:non-ribosomal peptide synthetase n=1 Tax=unclassified Anabaena TaxID=2619674 RepID=UPI0039C6616A
MQNEKIYGFQLAPQQKHLWQLQQQNNQAYRSLVAIEITGNLHLTTLKTALEVVVQRHQILRTEFHCLPGMNLPLQVITDNSNIFIEYQDLSGRETHKQQQAIASLIESAKKQIFDFERSPSLQISLLTLSPFQHTLLINLPSLSADTISLHNLVTEISLAYQGLELTDEPVQYILFSEWQNELLTAPEAEIGRAYWQQKDLSHVSGLQLPTVNQSVAQTAFYPQVLTRTIHPELAAKISAIADEFNTSESTFLLTCWQILLWRLTGVADMVVGTACDGRPEEELKETLGLFARYLPLNCHLENDFKLGEVLEELALVKNQAEDWQDCFTWEQVFQTDEDLENPSPNLSPARREALNLPHSLIGKGARGLGSALAFSTHVPFLPFCFDFFEQSRNLSTTGEVSFNLSQTYVCFDQFHVKLSFIRSDDFLVAEFHYDAGLFSATDIADLAAQYQILLESVIQNPHTAIGELTILPPAQRQHLLIDFNNTQIDFLQVQCLHQLFDHQVERTPNHIAVTHANEQLTYNQLNHRANQLAHHLQKLGVKPDVLVGICMERSLEMVVALLGVLKAGGAYLPIDPMYPQERVTFMVEDAQTPVILTQQKLISILPPHSGKTICLDTDWEAIAQENTTNPVSDVTIDHLAYVIYTSGSTGKPKGVMLPHRAICNHMLWMQQDFPLTATDKVLQKTPFSFDASVWEFYAPLLVGAQLVMAQPGGHQDSDYLVQTIVEQKITVLQVVPTLLRMLLENDNIQDCTSLKRVFCGGEALSVELQERFFNHLNADLINLYGPTETCIDATFWTCQPGTAKQIVPIGQAIANTQVYILDQHLQPVPLGVSGELHIGGAGLAKGYLHRPDLTQEKFIPNPFGNGKLYKTGDLARFLPDGNIEYLGRIDHQVKIRGFRIELGEIEALLSQYPQVRSSAVIAREDEPGNPRLVAYIVPQPGHTLNDSELQQYLHESLPDYMVPSAFVMLEALPLTPNGKLNRHALPAPDTLRQVSHSYLPPRDAIELQLVNIWEDILNVRPVGVQDNFFNLGGHSLMAVRLMAQIQQQLGKNLPLATLFQHPTIAQIADVVRQDAAVSPWSPLVAIQPQGTKPPFFCVPGAGGNVLYFYHLARHLGLDQPFYGLQALGLDGESQPHTRIEDIAKDYIQAIKTVQPEGPYYLGGHSFGGQVAFEMAQQLLAVGEQVAVVVIFDTPAPLPGILPERFDWDSATWLVYLSQIISRLCGQQLLVSYSELQSLDPEAQLHYFQDQLTAVGLLPPETGVTQVRGLVQVFQANKQARYLPTEVYPTKIALFRASELHPDDAASAEIDENMLPQDAAWGWSDFASTDVDVHWIPGDHLSMIVNPHVQVLAEQLKTYFEQV